MASAILEGFLLENQVIAKSSDSELNKLITVLPIPEKAKPLPLLPLLSPAQVISCKVGTESWKLLAATFDGELHLVGLSLMNFIIGCNRLNPKAVPFYSDGVPVAWERVARAAMEFHDELKQVFFETDLVCEVVQPFNHHECQRFVTNLMDSGLLNFTYQRRAAILSDSLADRAVWETLEYRCLHHSGLIPGRKIRKPIAIDNEIQQLLESEIEQGLIPGLSNKAAPSELPLSIAQRGHKVCRSLFGGKHGRSL